ncbi:MAG: hypothetical protein IPM39_08085 [Chloroflexi bacterium]|nr:hypothetical protein [Chloroflexota bacterium]
MVAALALFAFLYCMYLFTFNGRFTSIDELSLYAHSESLVQHGEWTAPQLNFAAYHNPVGPSEPGYAIAAAPLYWLAQRGERFNNIQTTMLLNPLLTALTAVFLYAAARLLNYSHPASIMAALAFGLTTLAWPYARSFYREPLVGFGWMVGLYGLLAWRYGGQRRWAVTGVLALCLTLLVKSSAIAGIPLVLLAALAGMDGKRQWAKVGAVLAVVMVVFAVLFQAAFLLRFGGSSSLANWTNYAWQGGLLRIYGQLFSPGKGLIFYSPSILLAAFGLVWLASRHRAAALAAGLPLLALVVAYSGYAAWYGGQSWGPRFLLPALPLFFLGVAALWDHLRHPVWRGLTVGLLLLGLLLQAAVSTADWGVGSEPLYRSALRPEETTGLALANVALSPPLVQLARWGSDALDLLWLHPDLDGRLAFSGRLAVGWGTAVLLALGLGWLALRGRVTAVTLLLPPLWATAVLLAWGSAATPGYPGLTADEGRALARWAAGTDNNPYTLVTMSNEFHIYFYLGFLKGRFTHHWYSPTTTDGFAPILQKTSGQRVTLIMDRVHILPDNSGKDLEWWLNEQIFRANSSWVGGFELVNYANLPLPLVWQPANAQFGESFGLDRFSLSQEQFPPNDTLGVQLSICRRGPLPEYHHLFVHLISAGGSINGYDGPIRFGAPLASWEVGDCLVEQRAILIPAEAVPGVYDLILGFDTTAGPLLVANQTGEAAQYIVLDQVEIGPRRP